MAGEGILIVEDDPVLRLYLEKVLERSGYLVTATAASGEEALECAARRRPDLVLMDINLAGAMDGIEAARELRRRVACPVVFLTAHYDQPTLERAREAEPAGFIVKPIEEHDVRATVAMALTKEQAVRRVEEHGLDLLSILDELEVGTAMINQSGCLSFISRSAVRLLGVEAEAVLGHGWRQALPADAAVVARMEALLAQPPSERHRLPITVGDRPKRQLEIDVRDDPRPGLQQRILVFYDKTEVHDLRRVLKEKAHFHDLVGRSPAMERVYDEIRQAAGVDWPVLIEGETGTGKELVARAIHASSPRRRAPFLAVNCAGLTESLLTSQLFGHRKGAFTGAVSNHRGFFEVADGGTLFLDEIGDVSMPVQTNLLRVLEEQRVTPLGSTASRKVDVRILTATHRDLTDEVEQRRFRADLLYRIRVARVTLPPLRERGEDLSLLAIWFLDRCRATTGKPVEQIDARAMALLAAYSWPGNVRELKSAIEHAVIRCRGSMIQPADLPPEIVPSTPGLPPDDGDETARILAALEQVAGNRSRAARLLGISRATFYRRLRQLDITPE